MSKEITYTQTTNPRIDNLGVFYTVSIVNFFTASTGKKKDNYMQEVLTFSEQFKTLEDAEQFVLTVMFKNVLRAVNPPARGTGSIKEILRLFKTGHTRKQIVELGFNRSTVNRQIAEYVKKTTYAITIAKADESGEEEEENEDL